MNIIFLGDSKRADCLNVDKCSPRREVVGIEVLLGQGRARIIQSLGSVGLGSEVSHMGLQCFATQLTICRLEDKAPRATRPKSPQISLLTGVASLVENTIDMMYHLYLARTGRSTSQGRPAVTY